MRYIDINLIDACKPDNWDVNARQWLTEVRNAQDKSAEFTRLGSKWSPFKDNFVNQFGDKCWYSEVPRIATDFNVDHFRPKGAVKKAKESYAVRVVGGQSQKHTGYWWLAFEPKNYRYSCQYANQPRDNGGKHDYFPLQDESTRVWGQCSLTNHNVEDPILIDPCVLADVQLLSFEKSPGMAHSRYDQATDKTKYERVRTSAKCYNLNHKTVKGKRLEVITSVQQDLELLESIYGLPLASKQLMQVHLDNAEIRLIEACNRKSPFSAAAVAFVKPKKTEPWLANILGKLDLKD
ncbi:hypothetical protein [Pseudoalteromonas sp. NZS127]|uniref:hypothetical protein n=1 Tax=Pseudoalteromonas TaxID=53246 RepID=UPI0018CD12BE|nr:hypothetical protein [Pseudoalteromonas sp. NZS127]MBH0070468.1 hypothetical protein [Pseudoalteromonas sp. NZS127]